MFSNLIRFVCRDRPEGLSLIEALSLDGRGQGEGEVSPSL